MENPEETSKLEPLLKRRKLLLSALSTGLTAVARPLHSQIAQTDTHAPVKNSVQNRSDLGVQNPALLTLFLCGDVMTGRGIDQVLPHPSNPVLYEEYIKSARGYVQLAEEANGPIPKPVGFSYIWGDALTQLERRQPTCRIINLETAVTRSEDVQKKAVNYRMNPANISCITAARIDCCALANNHVLDWGYPG